MGDARFAAAVETARRAFYYPFDCTALVDVHAACIESHDWRKCENAREAMDDCIEAGERRRFSLLAQCSRFRRLHQACLMQGGSNCAAELYRLQECVLTASAPARVHAGTQAQG
jgi:nicotinic acid phosphoribosyltransferase